MSSALTSCLRLHAAPIENIVWENQSGYYLAIRRSTLRGNLEPFIDFILERILQAIKGERPGITVFGTDYDTPDGTCIRDYIHVDDLADAHLRALDYLMKGGDTNWFNLGTGNGFSVKQIIDAAEKVTGMKAPVEYGPRREGDPARLIADSRKAAEILGWIPKYQDVTQIVETAWKWHNGPRGGHY